MESKSKPAYKEPDTEGNVCAEVVLSGTLAKELAGMMSPNRYYVLPHAFILKIGGEETRIQGIESLIILILNNCRQSVLYA